MTDHYVSMSQIRATKKKKKKTPSIEEVFSDPLSTVSSDEDNTSADFDSPSCSTSGTSTPAKSSHSMESPYEMFAPFSTRKVILRPGPSGIGLSVAGGVHSPTGLLPVFITDIDPGGLAEQSQSLKVGDRIVRVNGENMEGKRHRDVVLSIKSAGSSLMLEVTEGPENIMKYVNIE